MSAIQGSWHKVLKTETAVRRYRDYILAINSHENKGVGTKPAYFRNAEAFFQPFLA
jgi:hypothetical protein